MFSSSLRELSRKTGVAPSTIKRIFDGKVSPNIETVKKIIEPFGYKLKIEPCNIVEITQDW
jgi:predicted transcriptional regulator